MSQNKTLDAVQEAARAAADAASKAAAASTQLRQDLLGESKVDPGLLVRMDERLSAVEKRQNRVERNPVVWVGFHLAPVGGLVSIILGGLGVYWLKAKLGL